MGSALGWGPGVLGGLASDVALVGELRSDRAGLCPLSGGQIKGRRPPQPGPGPLPSNLPGETRTQLEHFSWASWLFTPYLCH